MTAMELYEMLLSAYGTPRWWSEEPYTVMVQAVLVQHTTWHSVEKVTEAVGERLTPEAMLARSQEELEALFRPCGFAKGKAETVRRLTSWYASYSFCVENLTGKTDIELREELLSLKGVGPETADVLLVFCFQRASFIIGAYTRRLLQRLGLDFADDGQIRRFFEENLPRDYRVYGWFHWLILDHGIQRCRKVPLCDGCCLWGVCHYRDAREFKAPDKKSFL